MKSSLMIIVAFVLGAGLLWAQATAEIHGTVQDPSGAAISAAAVKATQTETGVSRSVTTEADGSYIFTNLPLGPYNIDVSKEGFTTNVQSGIVLQVNSNPEVRVTLQIGATTQTVNVEANVTQVETRSVGVGTVVENQRVLDLPLNGRQPTDLIALSGAAVEVQASPSFAMNTGIQISVAGGNGYGVQYNLDGANHVNFFDGTGLILPFPDALLEFKLSTSTQDPSNSGRSGATVNAVTKSGTNSFHGDAFEFIRNYDLNARDFFATRPDGLKRNQFGGTFGGPIRKDKLFFFIGYEGTMVRQSPIGSVQFVPTAQELVGNFTTFASPECQNGQQVTLRAPFVNNMISPSLLSPAAVKIANLLPAGTGPCGAITVATPLHENDNQAQVRVDYQLSDKQTLFARYMLAKQQDVVPYTLDPTNVLTAGGVGANDQFTSVAIGDTYLFSGTKVNSFRLFVNRISAILPGANMFGPANVGINAYTYQPNYLTLSVTGGFSLGSGNYSENSFAYTTAFGVNDDFSWVHGAHQFAFGGFALRSIEWSVAESFSGGTYSSTGQTTGLGMADFLLGDVATLRQATPTTENLSQPFVGLYAQDTWKITRKLTMTYGVNWDPFFGMTWQQGDVYSFSLGNYYAGTTSKVVAGAPPGFMFPGDPGFPGKSGINSQYDHFDPRIGLAWDPFGDGKTAIRIGTGIAHGFIAQDIALSTATAPPFGLETVVSGAKLDNPYPQGDPYPYYYNPKNPVWPTTATVPCIASTCAPTFVPIPATLKTEDQYSWNLGVQRQITQKWFLAATYIGTHITHVWSGVELNPAVYVPGNCVAGQYGLTAAGPCTSSSNITSRRVLNLANPTASPLGNLTEYDDGGTQSYNGLLASTTYRLASGLSLNANYTWSHCIGLPQNANSGISLGVGTNYVDQGYGQNVYPVNRNFSVGNCIEDRRQVGNITLVYRTPKFTNSVARILASDWTLGSIIQARSGAPINIVTNVITDPATGFGGAGTGSQRPNQLLPNVYSPTQGQSCGTPGSFCEQWLNPAAFAAPATGTAGNLGVYAVFGPAFWQWDQELTREFYIRESQRIEVRVEAFNITNSLRLGNPGTTVGSSSTFGLITADATPPSPVTAPARVMQFALKYVF